MATPETPIWAVEQEPNSDWRPSFFQDARSYLSFIHKERVKEGKFSDKERALAKSILLKTILPEEENFDPRAYADDVQLQDTFLHLISWRNNTIDSEIARRVKTERMSSEFIPHIDQTTDKMSVESILEYFDYTTGQTDQLTEDTCDLLSFVLIQGRREEFIQNLASEEFMYDYMGDDFRDRYKALMFEDFDQFKHYANLTSYFKQNEGPLISDIQQHVYGNPAEPKKIAEISLKLFIQLKLLYGRDFNSLSKAFQRLGIPLNEEAIHMENISPSNLTGIAEFIGRYLSNMNHTHLRG